MENIFYKNWQNQNELRSFPFIDPTGSIPEWIFVDLSISCFGNVFVFLTDLSITSKKINGSFMDSLDNTYTFSKEVNSTDKKISIYNKYNRNVGVIVLSSDFYKKIINIGEVLITPYASGETQSIRVYPSCVLSINNNQIEYISIDDKKKSGIFNFIESPDIKIDGTGSDIIFNASGSSVDDECCTLIDSAGNPITVLTRLNAISTLNGKILIKIKDSGQPSNVLDNRQIIRINSIPNGIQIGAAN